MNDKYAWALLLKEDKTDYPDNTPLKDIYHNKAQPISNKQTTKTSTLDRILLTLYYNYNFDMQSFKQVYETQNDIIHPLTQIINKKNYRFQHQTLKEKPTFPRYIHLNTKKEIPTPQLTNIIDYTQTPIAISPPIKKLQIIEAKAENLSKGHIIIDQNKRIHDIININKVFFDTQPYGNRLQFLYRFRDYEPIEQLIAYEFYDIYEIAEILNTPHDITIKPLGQNYLKTKWFQYNKNAVFSTYVSKNGNESYNKQRKNVTLKQPYLKTLGGKTLGTTKLKPTLTWETIKIMRKIVDEFDAQAISYRDYAKTNRKPVWKPRKNQYG
jgi:hypothetical protein